MYSISDIRWLETRTVRPSAASDLIRLRIHRMPSGSSPLTGSSNIRICGSPSSAAAMPSRCRMPSENPLVRLDGHVGQADQAEHLVHPAPADPVGLGQAEQVVAGGAAAVDRPGVQQRADLVHRGGQRRRTAGR